MQNVGAPQGANGSLHLLDRRRVLQGAAGIAAAGALAGVGLASAGAGRGGAGTPAPTEPFAGWNLYTSQAAINGRPDMIRLHKPTAIRWFVEWDLIHLQVPGGPRIPEPPDWSFYKDFLAALAPSESNPDGVHLIIQIWVKYNNWRGTGWWFEGQEPGTTWAKPQSSLNFPADPGASYAVFVNSLVDTLQAAGVPSFEIGAWNEIDGRYELSLSGTKRVANYPGTWHVQLGNWAWWTGGVDVFRSLHETVPGAVWTSNGIDFPSWVEGTSADRRISVIDLHRYFTGDKTSDQILTHVESKIAEWDAHAPSGYKRPFFMGELASNSLFTAMTVREAARIWQRHAILWKAHLDPSSPIYGRYLGAIAHVALPATAEDPVWAWWKWRPEYEQYFDPGTVVDPSELVPGNTTTTTTTATVTTAPGTTTPPITTPPPGGGSSGGPRLPKPLEIFLAWLVGILMWFI